MDPASSNYDPSATCSDPFDCGWLYGCLDPLAFNYNSSADFDDGSCVYVGCLDPLATNYGGVGNSNGISWVHPLTGNIGYVTVDDGSCVYPVVKGCTDPTACNYDPLATFDDGTCDYSCYGCTDPIAINYDPSATIDDGSCNYTVTMPPGDCAGEEVARTDDSSWSYTTAYGSEPAEIMMSHPNFSLFNGNASGFWVRIVHSPPALTWQEKWQGLEGWWIKIKVGGTYSDAVYEAFKTEFTGYGIATSSSGGFQTVTGITFGANTYTELTWGTMQFDQYINKLNSFQDASGNDVFNPPLIVGTDWSETVWQRITTLAAGFTNFGYATTECCNYDAGGGDWQPGSC
jgi:hypothetical protein